MENKIHAVCQECGNEFDYVLRPGYPRKYCDECKVKKKQEFEDRQPVEIIKPGKPMDNETFKKAPVVASNGHLAMYVSYAKDIFCAYVSSGQMVTMEACVAKVKQAMQELS